uniref:Uncharacterized protein n=1 Tax=Romanomermis culicivorax TaxID=13658 RepID=A0A915L1C7_ROMCU
QKYLGQQKGLPLDLRSKLYIGSKENLGEKIWKFSLKQLWYKLGAQPNMYSSSTACEPTLSKKLSYNISGGPNRNLSTASFGYPNLFMKALALLASKDFTSLFGVLEGSVDWYVRYTGTDLIEL